MSRRRMLGMTGARFVPWLVLSVGLATTAVLYFSILNVTTARNSEAFKVAIGRLQRELNQAVSRQVAVLDAVAGAVSIDPNMSQRDFDTFYQQLAKGKDAGSAEAIGFTITRPWEKRAELAANAAARGITDFKLRPDGFRKDVYAVVLLQPTAVRKKLVAGYDMSTEPTRGKAMALARKSRRPAMTSRIYLAKDGPDRKEAFMLYMPIYDVGDNFLGFVYSAIHAEDLFKGLFPPKTDAKATADTPDDKSLKGLSLTLWSNGSVVLNHQDRTPDDSVRIDHELDVDLPEVQQTLRAKFVASTAFGSPGQIRPYVLPVGSAISVMLFMLATVLRRAQETSERRESEQTLLAEVGRLTLSAAEDATVLTEIAHNIAKTLDVICRIDIVEPDGTLRTVNTRTEYNEALVELEREFPRLKNDPLLRAALETGITQQADTLLANDEAHRAKVEPLKAGPIVIVPMRIRNRAIGALTLTRKQGEIPLSKDEVALLEAIAVRIALAVDNARLYEAVQEENDNLERRVEERTRDLEASNHELESFCYSVSHDLRTPLRSLDGFGRALKEDYGDQLDEQAHDYIDRIRASTKRMDELITALLTLSRLTRREILPSVVDATTMVRDLFHDLDPDNKVELELEDGLEIFADGRMLAIVFENLLSNAIKFSSRGDHPKIVVGKTPDDAVFVRDNGAGFDMQYANKLFQPFERLHSVREFPGHGIGLATVERIVRRHGGEVRAEGELGVGATFFVRFPSQI